MKKSFSRQTIAAASAITLLFGALATAHAQTAQSTVARARQLIAVDSTAQAVTLLVAATESGKDSASYHVWLAAAYADQGSRANFLQQVLLANRVRRELLRAVIVDSTSVDAHSELSRFYLTAPMVLGGSFSRAENEAKIIAATHPARSHGLLGFIAHHRGDLKTAEREMRAAIAAAPDSAWPYTTLAFLLGEEQRNDEAFALWAKSAALDTVYKTSYLQMGEIGATTGTHLVEAAQALQTYIAHPPRPNDKRNIASAKNKLGQVYEKLGRIDDAKRTYREAIELAPNSSAYKASLKGVS